ncbi:L,D-transpeptidase [Candidatus Gottesmanbacteria bacterium]|nr:L,D-transpeptidase [Candidatus Gottesmanbacteria bacterium]
MAKRRSHFPLSWIVVGCFIFIVVLLFNKLTGKSSVCANSITCAKDLSATYQYGKNNVFMGKDVNSPDYIADNYISSGVLGETSEKKHIYVDLQRQSLSAFAGDKKVMEFPISSGKWFPTPTGEFKIWIKLRYAHMSGGNPADGTYYNLYNIPYTMFYSGPNASAGRGFSLHGAYWHNNFGYPMSHGCVNIRPEDAKKLYYWAGPESTGDTTNASDTNPGTAITIFGQPPT